MSLKKSDLAAVRELIECPERFVIAVHTRPDVDTLGSALALARGLRSLGRDVTVLSDDPIPDSAAWLPDIESVQKTVEGKTFEVGIFCDFDTADRAGEPGKIAAAAYKLLIIDHHRPPDGPETNAVLCVRDTTAAATGELVFEILHGMEIIIDEATAEQLMAAIVGDTGGFRFSNVSAQTLEFASRLIALGASPSRAAKEIYESRSIANTMLLGTALLSLHSELDGRLSWATITREDFKKYGATDADTESIVNQVRAVKGVEMALLFRELEPDKTRVSLRSWGRVDANAIANKFGGGGHVAAAGITIDGPLDEAREAVLAEVRNWMAS